MSIRDDRINNDSGTGGCFSVAALLLLVFITGHIVVASIVAMVTFLFAAVGAWV